MAFWGISVRHSQHDLHSEFVQQRADPGLHQPGSISGRRSRQKQHELQENACRKGDLPRSLAPSDPAHRARSGLRQSPQYGREYDLRAHLPAAGEHGVEGLFSLSAHHLWLFAAWSDHFDLLLYHHLKTVQEFQGSGPEEEGAKDDHHPHPLLLHLLVALPRRHPGGHSDDAKHHISQLFSGTGCGEMDLLY